MRAINKLTNAKRSIKKLFIDFLETSKGEVILFDKSIEEGYNEAKTALKWFLINFDDHNLTGPIARWDISIGCCTLSDEEGEELSKLQDLIIEMLEEDNSDRKIIPFYDTSINPWTQISGITLSLVPGGTLTVGEDSKSYCIMGLTATWPIQL